MEALPNELGEALCMFLNPSDLASLMLVSKRWNRLASSNAVWKPVYFAASNEHDMRTGAKAFEKCGQGEIDYWGGSEVEVHQEMFDAFLPHDIEGEHPLVVSPLTRQDGKELANKERHPRQEGRVKDGVDYRALLRQVVASPAWDKPVLIKVVVMGNLGVGKTSLVAKLSNGRRFDPSQTDSIPEKFDNHCVRMFYGTQEVRVSLWGTEMWDTSFSLEGVRRRRIEEGGEDYRRMRLITYPNTDVFLLCFDLTDMESFRYIESFGLVKPFAMHPIPHTLWWFVAPSLTSRYHLLFSPTLCSLLCLSFCISRFCMTIHPVMRNRE
ncbi:Rho GTPase [Balamuthia mandrillaris]